MSLFGLILLILFVWFVLRPVIRFFMTVNRLQREARRAAAGQARRSQPQSSERKAGWTTPASRRKKFDRNIGEYIEYEEVTTVSTPHAAEQAENGKYTRTESQIVDVEWEDIK